MLVPRGFGEKKAPKISHDEGGSDGMVPGGNVEKDERKRSPGGLSSASGWGESSSEGAEEGTDFEE